MTDASRAMFLKLAWFPPDTELLGSEARPLCLATWEAMTLMGLTLLDREAEISPEDEYRQLMVYRWLHCEEPQEISRALWSGSWRAMLEVEIPEPLPADLLEVWQEEKQRLLALLEATEVAIRPRPRSGHDDTPFEVVGPDALAHRLSVVERATGRGGWEIFWEMPLYQFWQRYHAEMRWHSFWTVRPGKRVDPEAFAGFGEAVMANLREQAESGSESDEQ